MKTVITRLTAEASTQFLNAANRHALEYIANPYVELPPDAFTQFEEELLDCVREQDYERIAVLAALLAQAS